MDAWIPRTRRLDRPALSESPATTSSINNAALSDSSYMCDGMPDDVLAS
jgi:hypothetical protein